MAGNFRGVLIFVIFVVDLAVTKINDYPAHAQGQAVGVADLMTGLARYDDRTVNVAQRDYELTRIDENGTDVSLSLLSTSWWRSRS